MSIKERLTSIADKIREGLGITERLTLEEMEEKVPLVFQAGKDHEWNEFWDAYQDCGNQASYASRFQMSSWKNDIFKPKYKIAPTGNMGACFNSTGISGDLTKLCEIDTSKATGLNETFLWANLITRIGVIDASSITTGQLNRTFSNAQKLETIEKLVLPEVVVTFTDTFFNCNKLKNITVEGTFKNNFDIHYSPLTKESILSIMNALDSDTSGKTVSFSKAAVDKAFETEQGGLNGSDTLEWATQIAAKTNWTITLLS